MTPDQINNAVDVAAACERLSDVYLHGLGVLLLGTIVAIFLIGLVVGYKIRDAE